MRQGPYVICYPLLSNRSLWEKGQFSPKEQLNIKSTNLPGEKDQFSLGDSMPIFHSYNKGHGLGKNMANSQYPFNPSGPQWVGLEAIILFRGPYDIMARWARAF